MKRASADGPISFKVDVSRLPRVGLPVWLEADDDQRAALAEDHRLLEVARFRIDAVVAPWQHAGIKVVGKVTAAITQACIVSLEPVPAEIDEAFEAVLVPEDSRLARRGPVEGGELVLDADGPDMPESFSGNHVDVGALGEEFFELALDPYPRAPGAALAGETAAAGTADASPNPFREQLAKLARKP
jgi:hypothetical protein